MIIIVLVSVCFTLCNILLSRYINVTLLLILNIFTLGNLWLTHPYSSFQTIVYIMNFFAKFNWGNITPVFRSLLNFKRSRLSPGESELALLR